MLARQDISPQQSGKRSAESGAECSIVDADRHGVYGPPEGTVADGDAVAQVNSLPGLDDAGDEDGGSYICACKLYS